MILSKNIFRGLASASLALSIALIGDIPSAYAMDKQHEKVLIVGGSTAAGDGDDAGKHGFISRAFEELNIGTNVFQVDNESVIGANTQKITTVLGTYLEQEHPNIVILSDGFFNDIYYKIPAGDVLASLKEQVDLAAKSGAEVFVVSSPITVASLTFYKNQFAEYMRQEFHFASVAGKNVHVLDVFDQMEGYVKDHDLASQTLMDSDTWHPNANGDKIASDILSKDLKPYLIPTQVGVNPVSLKQVVTKRSP